MMVFSLSSFRFLALIFLGGIFFSVSADAASPLTSMLQKAQKAVVAVYVEKCPSFEHITPTSHPGDVLISPDQIALGSGVLISSKGILITSYHLVKNAQKIEVTLSDGQKGSAKLIAENEKTDLAVLKCSRSLTRPLPFLSLAPSMPPQLGEKVWAIGHPYGLTYSVSKGIISMPQRRLPAYAGGSLSLIQIDVLLGPGSSGGALLNKTGELIGITTAVLTGSSVPPIGFAISVSLINLLLASLP